MTLFTIGYEQLTLPQLQDALDRLQATLVDVRGVPSSRKKGFSGKALSELLGNRYVYKGDVLGNKGTHSVLPEGIEWVRKESKTSNLILLCLEASPADCHRHNKITGPYFGTAIHLFPQANEVLRSDELTRSLNDGEDYTCYDYEDVFTGALRD